jgi:hypothetical protein
MKNYFRAQRRGIDFEEMKSWRSVGSDQITEFDGVAATRSAAGLDGGSRFGGSYDAYSNDDGEVIVFEGTAIEELYDGVIVEPEREIARFTKGEWNAKLEDESAYDFESW